MKSGIGRGISLFLLPLIVSGLIRLWFATCRKRSHGSENRHEAEKQGVPFVGTCWHYSILGIFTFSGKESFSVMVSSSNDGDYLSKMVQGLGLSVVRGSRNRRGGPAAKELIKEFERGKNVGLVADGSQGPPRVAQPGAIFLASKTGGAILPMVWSSTGYISFNSWDKMILPRPFCRMDIFYGKPFWVPQHIKSAEMEEYRVTLEKQLNELYDKAWQMQGRKEH